MNNETESKPIINKDNLENYTFKPLTFDAKITDELMQYFGFKDFPNLMEASLFALATFVNADRMGAYSCAFLIKKDDGTMTAIEFNYKESLQYIKETAGSGQNLSIKILSPEEANKMRNDVINKKD